MSEHTPTPWEHTAGDVWIDARRQVCCGRGYTECCGEPDVEGGQELVAQTSEANAAFIVKAVNNHDALVKALEQLSACVFESGLTADNTEAWLEAKRTLAAVGGSSKP